MASSAECAYQVAAIQKMAVERTTVSGGWRVIAQSQVELSDVTAGTGRRLDYDT
jgi:hypothetical protein